MPCFMIYKILRYEQWIDFTLQNCIHHKDNNYNSFVITFFALLQNFFVCIQEKMKTLGNFTPQGTN